MIKALLLRDRCAQIFALDQKKVELRTRKHKNKSSIFEFIEWDRNRNEWLLKKTHRSRKWPNTNEECSDQFRLIETVSLYIL